MEATRQEQIARLGREVGPVQWIGSPNLGPWTWLGFFWEKERFWFGYGFTGRDFRLLVEADATRPEARAWSLLKRELPEVWNFSRAGKYLRLFAGDDLPGNPRAHGLWLRARALELHEYAVGK